MPAEENHKFFITSFITIISIIIIIYIIIYLFNITFLSTINLSLLITISDPTYRLFTPGFA